MSALPNFGGPRAFARYMLEGDRLLLRPQLDQIHHDGRALEAVLFREGCWQVEMVVIGPGAEVPVHRHNRCDSVDLLVGGSGTINVDPCVIGRFVGDAHKGRLAANLVRVPRGAWHGGKVGPKGIVFISFQQWQGPAQLIGEDWESWSPEHK